MATSRYTFMLDLHSTQSQITLPVTVADFDRELRISFSDGGRPYEISEGTIANFACKRPTYTEFLRGCIVEPDSGCVIYSFEEDTCPVQGLYECQIILYNAEGKPIASPKFMMDAAPRVVNGEEITLPDNDVAELDEIFRQEAKRQAAELEREAAENLRQVNTNKALTEMAELKKVIEDKHDSGEFDGKDGVDGRDGVSPLISVVKTVGGHEVNVTDAKGVETFFVPDGATGPAGVSVFHEWKGTNLIIHSAAGTSFADLKGERGEKGERGDGIQISKTFSSIAEMLTGHATDGVKIGAFVIISTEDENDPDNSRLYVKTETTYQFLNDLSGAQGIRGEVGPQGERGPEGPQGVAPHIGENGNWFIGENDTGVLARGKNGYTPIKGIDYYTPEDISKLKKEIGNDSNIKKGEADFSIAQKGDDSINNYGESTAYAISGTAFGDGTVAGSKGFQITAYNENAKTYTLDIGDYDSLEAAGYAVGDVFSIFLKTTIDNFGTITALNGNVVTVDNFLKLLSGSEPGTTNGDSYLASSYFRVAEKPTIGVKNIGTGAHTEGRNTKALADASHSEGRDNITNGKYAHTEGRGNIANYAAHAEGHDNKSLGYRSHTEGRFNYAIGSAAHAEGWDNTAGIGWRKISSIDANNKQFVLFNTSKLAVNDVYSIYESNSHQVIPKIGKITSIDATTNTITVDTSFEVSEGKEYYLSIFKKPDLVPFFDITDASVAITNGNITGVAAHAEGEYTVAIGDAAHAEGRETIAGDINSHAEGLRTQALASCAHSEGADTKATGEFAHAEGTSTIASGLGAHAEGYKTEASGKYAHAEGNMTHATGARSHAEGYSTEAIGNYSHAEGYKTEAYGERSHAEGFQTQATGFAAHAEGYSTQATASSAHAEGYSTVASKTYAHAEGFETQAKAAYSHAGGKNTIASAEAQTAIGKFNAEDANALFIVGNGESENARSNAFEVLTDGRAIIGKAPEEDMDVANKGYVDKALNSFGNITEAQATQVETINSTNASFNGTYASLTGKPTVPTALSQLKQSTSYRTVTDAEKAAWNDKMGVGSKYYLSIGDTLETGLWYIELHGEVSHFPLRVCCPLGVVRVDATPKIIYCPTFDRDFVLYNGGQEIAITKHNTMTNDYGGISQVVAYKLS